ncbi:MAG: nucleoside triphosphate pyrophosphohydrolase [Chloroflexi bacterium]|nr:nucleoside triphosphate pyrophosphohydrolase [Chloroflexota bacterium]
MASLDTILRELRETYGLDAADGVQLVSVEALTRRPIDPTMALVILPDEPGRAAPVPEPVVSSPADPDAGAYVPALLPGRHGHGADAAELLRRLYPAGHPVQGLDGASGSTVAELSSADLAMGAHLLEPLPDLLNAASPWGLPWLVARLRAPGGCPWDREQDHRSLRPFLLEEAYEVYDALDEPVGPKLAEELGDLLLQIVLHAEHAAEAGIFDLSDVQRSIMTKIVRRHPHVFGDGAARTTGDVTRAWEVIKADERAAAAAVDVLAAPTKPADPDMPAAFAGLSRSLPALAYANEMQDRAPSQGYDWPDLAGVIDKVAEEATELLQANDQANRIEEYGDLMFVLVNLARKLYIDPEASLRAASRKFARRFAGVERLAAERHLELKAMGLDALDDVWQDVKRQEEAARDEQAAAGRGDA